MTGKHYQVELKGNGDTLVAKVDGDTWEGKLTSEEKLRWNDGDLWKRAEQEQPERPAVPTYAQCRVKPAHCELH